MFKMLPQSGNVATYSVCTQQQCSDVFNFEVDFREHAIEINSYVLLFHSSCNGNIKNPGRKHRRKLGQSCSLYGGSAHESLRAERKNEVEIGSEFQI